MGAYVFVSMIAGGGAPRWGLAAIAIALVSAILLATIGFGRGVLALARLTILQRVALATIVVLPLLQLVPLPPTWWQALPGQELRRSVLALVGLADRWQPMTLEPVGTAYTAWMALAFAAFVVAVTAATSRELDRLLGVVLAIILLGILVGIVQVASGGSLMRLYVVAHHGSLIGFYANKNHMALALAVSVPMAGYLLAQTLKQPTRARWILLGYAGLVIPCLISTNSRAGLALGLVACAAVLLPALRVERPEWRIAIVAATATVAILVFSTSTFELLSDRFSDVDQDDRWTYLHHGFPLLRSHLPFGTGAGSFATVFATTEKLAWLDSTYLNHIHNDYVELFIEMGFLGVLALLVAVAALIADAPARLQVSRVGNERRLIHMAYLIIAMFALHSFVDYPLRRPACLVIFGLALGVAWRRGDAQVDGQSVRTKRAIPQVT